MPGHDEIKKPFVHSESYLANDITTKRYLRLFGVHSTHHTLIM